MLNYVWSLSDDDWDSRDRIFDYIGSCRVGNLCFDVLIRNDERRAYLSYDCYIGGIDDGYGYGKDGYPYTYGDGGDWDTLFPDFSKEEFQAFAEETFSDFIVANHLEHKATEEFREW